MWLSSSSIEFYGNRRPPAESYLKLATYSPIRSIVLFSTIFCVVGVKNYGVQRRRECLIVRNYWYTSNCDWSIDILEFYNFLIISFHELIIIVELFWSELNFRTEINISILAINVDPISLLCSILQYWCWTFVKDEIDCNLHISCHLSKK